MKVVSFLDLLFRFLPRFCFLFGCFVTTAQEWNLLYEIVLHTEIHSSKFQPGTKIGVNVGKETNAEKPSATLGSCCSSTLAHRHLPCRKTLKNSSAKPSCITCCIFRFFWKPNKKKIKAMKRTPLQLKKEKDNLKKNKTNQTNIFLTQVVLI